MRTLLTVLFLFLGILIITTTINAVPFASELTQDRILMRYAQDSMLISYYLNQSADTVQIQIVELTSGQITATFNGPTTMGSKSLYWNGRIDNAAGSQLTTGYYSFKVRTISSGFAGWTQIASNMSGNLLGGGPSTYTTLIAGYPCRGITVDTNTASKYFGRVYITISGTSSATFQKGVLRYHSDLSTFTNESDYILYASSSSGLWDNTANSGNPAPWGISVANDGELWLSAQPSQITSFNVPPSGGGNGMNLGRGFPFNNSPTIADWYQASSPRGVQITGTGANRILWWTEGNNFKNCTVGDSLSLPGPVNNVALNIGYARHIRFDDAGNLYGLYRIPTSTDSTFLLRWNAVYAQNASNYPLSIASAVWSIKITSDIGTRGNGLVIVHGDSSNLSDDSVFLLTMGISTDKGVYFVGKAGTASIISTLSTTSRVYDVPDNAATSATSQDLGVDFAGNLITINGGAEVIREYSPPGASDITISANPYDRIINISTTNTLFNKGIRGLGLNDDFLNYAYPPHTQTNYKYSIPSTLAVSDGSAIRGVAGGLDADMYNWKTRISAPYYANPTASTQPRTATLQFLRYARDHQANLFITVNTRGLVTADTTNLPSMMYYTTDTGVLTSLAADWVRYTNHIVQTYHKGDAITDSRDSTILSSLIWNSSLYSGDTFDTLLTLGDIAVPKVTYWEIGNEPDQPEASWAIDNSFTLDTTEYLKRYKVIVASMKAEDSTIKVGPCVAAINDTTYIATLLADTSVIVDFISYHPYLNVGDQTTIQTMVDYLNIIYSFQSSNYWQAFRDTITNSGRNPNTIEMVASEWNVTLVGIGTGTTMVIGEMVQALGSVESIFTFARLGLTAAHNGGPFIDQDTATPFAIYKSYEKLRDYMGDQLLDSYTPNNRVRVYTTRDSSSGNIAIWGLNFDNYTSQSFEFKLKGTSFSNVTIRQLALQNTIGFTSLTSGNWNRDGITRNEVDWVESSTVTSSTSDLKIVLQPATLTLILVQSSVVVPVELSQFDVITQEGIKESN